MARVQIYEGGNVQNQGVTNARYRAADYGPSPLAEGLKGLGDTVSNAVAKVDEIQDVQAKIEANRLAVEHTKLAEGIDRRVRETLGEGAHNAAELGAHDLDQGTNDILGRASPRARLLLEGELASRNATKQDSFYTHGFNEQAKALESSSVARIDNVLEMAAQEPDEEKARTLIAPIRQINADRARFFGKDAAWQEGEDRKSVSSFFKTRTLNLTQGQEGSAYAAMEYATKNRQYMTNEDYTSVVSAYNDNALDELAARIVDGSPLPSSTVSDNVGDSGEHRRTLDFDGAWDSWYLPQEGSTYVIDNNGYGVKYGINAKSHPGVDVKNLTEAQAKNIIKKEYWDQLGMDKLPPAVASMAFDTAVISGVGRAKQLLKDSGGDPDKFMEMRKGFLASLSAKDPKKYPPGTWDRRNRELTELSARQGTSGEPLPVGADTNLETFRSQVMARTDIGLGLKRKIIDRLEARRTDMRQEREIAEHEAAGALSLAAANLGDNYTSIKQLPQDAWMRASEATKAQLVASAKANKEQKPLDPRVAAQIGFLQQFSPKSLADPRVLNKLAAQGVPQKMISQLAQQGGTALGANAAAKPDYVSRSTLEALARPAFEAAGHRLWTTEADAKGNKAKHAGEMQEDAQRQINLLNYLENEGTAWSIANPGKKADTKTMQQWISTALIRTQKDLPFGAQNDQEVINSYGQKNYHDVAARLQSVGIQPTPANVANYLRRRFQQNHGLR